MERRYFLKTTPVLLGMAWQAIPPAAKKKKPLFSFSTLGCPKWSFEKIVQNAAENGYHGIEIRGIQGVLDLPVSPVFNTRERIATARRQVEDQGLRIVNLGASAQLHHADQAKRTEQLDDAKRFVDLAAQLNCPYIRVFPDDLPKEQDESATINLITSGLVELGHYAKGSGVSILLESHGKVVHSDLLRRIMQDADHPQVGLIWDFYNMWSVTKEAPQKVYQVLRKYIRHAHIKDATFANGQSRYVLPGQGEAPLREAVRALREGGYKGYYSFEWEKLWHPEIEEPEVAIPYYPEAMKKYFR